MTMKSLLLVAVLTAAGITYGATRVEERKDLSPAG